MPPPPCFCSVGSVSLQAVRLRVARRELRVRLDHRSRNHWGDCTVLTSVGVGVDKGISGATAAGAMLLAFGCAPPTPLPARAASAKASQCVDAPSAEDEATALDAMTVLSARATRYQDPCRGTCQIRSVQLVVRPPQGINLSRFDRILRCHNLRVLDGEVDASRIPNDPFGLRDSWLEIEVKPEDGNFRVTLSGDHIADTLQILRRAKAYAAAHAPASR